MTMNDILFVTHTSLVCLDSDVSVSVRGLSRSLTVF